MSRLRTPLALACFPLALLLAALSITPAEAVSPTANRAGIPAASPSSQAQTQAQTQVQARAAHARLIRQSVRAQRAPSLAFAGQYATLPQAQNVGDIFYSPNSFLFVTYGHSGIYSTPDTVIEAPGPPLVAREVNRTESNVFPGSQLARVVDDAGNLLPIEKRQGAVDWARSRLGDIYNWAFYSTQHISSGPIGTLENAQNCSQIVWAAYMRQGIDLDDMDWGPPDTLWGWLDRLAVFPYELVSGKHARVYQTV